MNLKILTTPKKEKPDAIIGRTGVIRIKKNLFESNEIIKGLRWEIAIDEDEKIIKKIYFLISKVKSNSIKFQIINDRISLNIKEILVKEKIKYPNKCKLKNFNSGNYKGYIFELQNC